MREQHPAEAAAAALRRAVAQFNGAQFWECHESLEDVWGEESGPLREFYHGVIQAAAGFVHVQRTNWHGAVRLLALAADNLAPFRPWCLGIDVAQLHTDALEWRRLLVELGPDRARQATLPPFPQIRLKDDSA